MHPPGLLPNLFRNRSDPEIKTSDILSDPPKKVKKRTRRKLKSQRRKPTETDPTPYKVVDICEISANAFYYMIKRPTNKFFITSLYKLNRQIEKSQQRPSKSQEVEDLIKKKLSEKYKIFRITFSKTVFDTLPPHRIYDHKIELEGPLPNFYPPLYKRSTEELKAVKDYLLENLDKGFITSSQSPFASPTLFVKKPNGELRFCIDYCKLNALTRNDPYLIPRIDEILGRLQKAKVFTKLDIRQAFHRIRIYPDSVEYTTFRTRYGSYKCQVLPFGLTNEPAIYQRFMNDILIDYLDDFCTAYLNDILIYSEDLSQHTEHVKKVLRRLNEAEL